MGKYYCWCQETKRGFCLLCVLLLILGALEDDGGVDCYSKKKCTAAIIKCGRNINIQLTRPFGAHFYMYRRYSWNK